LQDFRIFIHVNLLFNESTARSMSEGIDCVDLGLFCFIYLKLQRLHFPAFGGIAFSVYLDHDATIAQHETVKFNKVNTFF
jgi:hypothetical protein